MAINLETQELMGLVQALGPEEALGNLKVGELKGCCRRFGLKATGGKLDLLGRLGEHLLKAEVGLADGTQGEQGQSKKRGPGRPPKVQTTQLTSVVSAPVAAAEAAADAGNAAKRRKTGKGKPKDEAAAKGEAGPPPVPTPLRNSEASSMVEGEMRQALTVVFSAATATPLIPTGELPEATLEMGPERSAKMLLALSLPEIRHYCVGLGLSAQGSKLELVDQILGCLHMRWEEAKMEQEATMVEEMPAATEAPTVPASERAGSLGSPDKVQQESETIHSDIVEDNKPQPSLETDSSGPTAPNPTASPEKAGKPPAEEVAEGVGGTSNDLPSEDPETGAIRAVDEPSCPRLDEEMEAAAPTTSPARSSSLRVQCGGTPMDTDLGESSTVQNGVSETDMLAATAREPARLVEEEDAAPSDSPMEEQVTAEESVADSAAVQGGAGLDEAGQLQQEEAGPQEQEPAQDIEVAQGAEMAQAIQMAQCTAVDQEAGLVEEPQPEEATTQQREVTHAAEVAEDAEMAQGVEVAQWRAEDQEAKAGHPEELQQEEATTQEREVTQDVEVAQDAEMAQGIEMAECGAEDPEVEASHLEEPQQEEATILQQPEFSQDVEVAQDAETAQGIKMAHCRKEDQAAEAAHLEEEPRQEEAATQEALDVEVAQDAKVAQSIETAQCTAEDQDAEAAIHEGEDGQEVAESQDVEKPQDVEVAQCGEEDQDPEAGCHERTQQEVEETQGAGKAQDVEGAQCGEEHEDAKADPLEEPQQEDGRISKADEAQDAEKAQDVESFQDIEAAHEVEQAGEAEEDQDTEVEAKAAEQDVQGIPADDTSMMQEEAPVSEQVRKRPQSREEFDISHEVETRVPASPGSGEDGSEGEGEDSPCPPTKRLRVTEPAAEEAQ